MILTHWNLNFIKNIFKKSYLTSYKTQWISITKTNQLYVMLFKYEAQTALFKDLVRTAQ